MSVTTARRYVANVQDIVAMWIGAGREPLRFMGRTEVAHYLGLSCLGSLTGVDLPEPDAIIGDRNGWTTDTIDAWKLTRPGRGRWGKRDASNKEN